MRHYEAIKDLYEQNINECEIVALTGASLDEVELCCANIRIENRMKAEGFKAFMDRQQALEARGHHIEMDSNMGKLRELLKPSAMALTESIMQQSKGRPHIAVKVCKHEDPFTLALTTIRCLIMAVTNDKTALTALCDRVCQVVAPHLEAEERFRVGLWLVRIVCNASQGHFEIVKYPQANNLVFFVEATETYREWEKENTKLLAELAVMFRPMVVPPRPWDGLHHGGFYDEKLQQPFIRNNKKATARTHGPRAIPLVFQGVNKIQATGYTINNFVLDVAVHLREKENVYFKGFHEFIQDIESFSDVTITGTHKTLTERIKKLEASIGITKKARDVHGKGFGEWVKRKLKGIKDTHKLYKAKKELEDLRYQRQILMNHTKMVNSKTSKNRVVNTALETAENYREFKSIYFPHNLDWRGRVYPITAGLTTQGTSLQKALLKFDSGKPIGTEEALEWLMVHTANSYGLDKSPWQDRIKWTKENTELITRVALDPLGNLDDWTNKEVDCPWLFLAACEQMKKYYDHGLDAVVDISIPMDGTCNGAQHYAAMTRDIQGAFGVNVAPNGTQGLSERLKALRANLGNPKVTQSDQKITMELNDSIKRIIE